MIERFLDEVRAQHQSKVSDTVLQDALREMRAHLEESRDALLATGKPLEESESLAVKAFGDPTLAVPKRERMVEWRITQRSLGLMAFLATLSSFVGLSVLNRAIQLFPKGSELQQMVVLTLVVAAIMATPAVMAFYQRKVHITAMAVSLLFVFLGVNGPTQMGTRPWRLLTEPSALRLDEVQREQAEFERAKQVLQAVENYRHKLSTGAEPNSEFVLGQELFPSTLMVTGDGSETKIFLSSQTNRPYFSDSREARAESLRRMEEFLPSLRANASDTSSLDLAKSRAYRDWIGNAWENSRDYLAGAGIFFLWALTAQFGGVVSRRIRDRWWPRKSKKA